MPQMPAVRTTASQSGQPAPVYLPTPRSPEDVGGLARVTHAATPHSAASSTPGKTRRNSQAVSHNADTIPATVSGLHFLVPLPRDVDATVQIPVTVRGIPGLRIVNCAWINKHMPNEDIMRDVDNASRCIDDLVQLNARRHAHSFRDRRAPMSRPGILKSRASPLAIFLR